MTCVSRPRPRSRPMEFLGQISLSTNKASLAGGVRLFGAKRKHQCVLVFFMTLSAKEARDRE